MQCPPNVNAQLGRINWIEPFVTNVETSLLVQVQCVQWEGWVPRICRLIKPIVAGNACWDHCPANLCLAALWSSLNNISRSTRGMSFAHRQEVLDAHMNYSNWKKLIKTGPKFHYQYYMFLTVCCSSLHADTMEACGRWSSTQSRCVYGPVTSFFD